MKSASADDRDDASLVDAAQRGERAALEALLDRHHDRIYAICRRLTGNDADAADASQEALIAIVRGLPRFDGRSQFSTWSYRIAVNASLDELRRRKRRPLPMDEDHTEIVEAGMAGSPGGGVGDTDTRLDVDAALL